MSRRLARDLHPATYATCKMFCENSQVIREVLIVLREAKAAFPVDWGRLNLSERARIDVALAQQMFFEWLMDDDYYGHLRDEGFGNPFTEYLERGFNQVVERETAL